MITTSTSNKLALLIEQAIAGAPDRDQARERLLSEMSKYVDSQLQSGSRKRLQSLINGSYKMKLDEAITFTYFFGLKSIEELLDISAKDFRTAEDILEAHPQVA
ncbi:hypothetical protein [Marinoscillum furvescens]|uniref:Uncharacterized protein n=1 Tax=Marinoscillum furvescens DSM 4134 TaxID=1122208 RepID=A0A3D9L714_MARFU|nr:hypothetical protein [Marinoscillum furvescens]REE01090.1 hypothetical protein C7460_104110 [Marinoscillum furvescens DSM 4134]